MSNKNIWKRLKKLRLKDLRADAVQELRSQIDALDENPNDREIEADTEAIAMARVYGLTQADLETLNPRDARMIADSAMRAARMVLDAYDRIEARGLSERRLARSALDEDQREELDEEIEAQEEELEEIQEDIDEEREALEALLEEAHEKRAEELERAREELEEEQERLSDEAEETLEKGNEQLEEALERLDEEKEHLDEELERIDEENEKKRRRR
jgi:hypothetical protein